nr:proline-rich protein 36-like [Aegilops tauschii subsp. strangulata]
MPPTPCARPSPSTAAWSSASPTGATPSPPCRHHRLEDHLAGLLPPPRRPASTPSASSPTTSSPPAAPYPYNSPRAPPSPPPLSLSRTRPCDHVAAPLLLAVPTRAREPRPWRPPSRPWAALMSPPHSVAPAILAFSHHHRGHLRACASGARTHGAPPTRPCALLPLVRWPPAPTSLPRTCRRPPLLVSPACVPYSSPHPALLLTSPTTEAPRRARPRLSWRRPDAAVDPRGHYDGSPSRLCANAPDALRPPVAVHRRLQLREPHRSHPVTPLPSPSPGGPPRRPASSSPPACLHSIRVVPDDLLAPPLPRTPTTPPVSSPLSSSTLSLAPARETTLQRPCS